MTTETFSPPRLWVEAVADPVARARIDLAAALRWAAKLGLSEGICNHFSLALPGQGDRYLINPFSVHWAEMRASQLLMLE